MTIKTRRKIFYSLVALFIILGGGVVFYAQGWRLDVGSWHFTKIGGIYIRAYPENATFFLNGKPVQNESGFLTPGTLISNLLPRTYRVVLKAPNYDTWQENATVEPSQVVQFKYAVLVPATSTSASASTTKIVAANALAFANRATTTTDPYNSNQKVIIAKNKISIFDISTGNNETDTTTTQSAAIESSTISGNNISVTWISGNVIGVLQNDGELYLYDTSANGGVGTLTKLADDVKHFAVTDDGTMVAALENQSLEIFSLIDSSIYYRFNLPDIGNAEQIIWYRDYAHLFVVYPDHVSFLDFADSGLTNFTVVANIANGTKPYYDSQANILYITAPSGKTMEYQFSK